MSNTLDPSGARHAIDRPEMAPGSVALHPLAALDGAGREQLAPPMPAAAPGARTWMMDGLAAMEYNRLTPAEYEAREVRGAAFLPGPSAPFPTPYPPLFGRAPGWPSKGEG